jgi:hypothetical protein
LNLENEPTIKLIQANMILSLNDYERTKAYTANGANSLIKSTNLLIRSSESDQNLNQTTSVAISARISLMLSICNELHSKINEKTLELIFFKSFIGDLSINKIICELFSKT